MLTPGVTVSHMPKMALFFFAAAAAAVVDDSETSVRVWAKYFKCNWKILFSSFRKCYGLSLHDVNPWKYRILVFFCLLSSVINISSSSISCTVTPKPGNYTIFWKNSIKSIFQVYLDILLKLWLILCCHQQKIQKMNHFWHFNDYNSGAVHNSRTKASIFLICSLGFVRRYISFPHFKTFKIKSLGGPFALCPAL